MTFSRRTFLAASAALCAAPFIGQTAELLPRGKGRRVVIVGGGWGGLSAARHLRDLAPDLEVVLLEKNPVFWSCPLSNKWLVNLIDTKHLVHDYATAASAYGYTFIQTEVSAIDRDQRRVVTTQGTLDYDWLILAVGIRYDYEAWYGNDRRAIDHTLRNFPCAYIPGKEPAVLKEKLNNFKGGDLVMTIPPMPYRCPPSPYERACMIGWLLKSRKIKGKLIILDPNPSFLGFSKIFAEQYPDQIVYVPNARVKSVDPFNKTISTDFDDIRFDDAILMAPQQAGDLVWKAGLIAKGGEGKPTGWADQDPVHLHAREDERVFLIGDLIDKVSPLFGHYPKSGHMANHLGRIAAREIASRAKGALPEKLLPEGVCYVYSSIDPMEVIRIDSRYKFRGDGLIAQTVKQFHDPNPRGEDLQWAQSMFAEFLAFKA
ncbi:NAD(FAD)-dependent dehydrogenase [Sulfuricella denitrificans skB26]|uniref:NAD(FAD)-dependent dehydrogenase n=1 Tax=Sulfuricella denitrificans (strain DSM 22764 / NBRC 105220 / skB26) TaxID=1163617 RepID=S6AAS2_SULDS|nr:FAD/NAD(P)-binding oxidoreductase [Sulfuricella denitrificans]BAN34013.1 NAD(FAD)-dependent dehydrogenase [Sulfuricella denitrificans skB26]